MNWHWTELTTEFSRKGATQITNVLSSTSSSTSAIQANSGSSSQRDEKWVPAKLRWCSAAGEVKAGMAHSTCGLNVRLAGNSAVYLVITAAVSPPASLTTSKQARGGENAGLEIDGTNKAISQRHFYCIQIDPRWASFKVGRHLNAGRAANTLVQTMCLPTL